MSCKIIVLWADVALYHVSVMSVCKYIVVKLVVSLVFSFMINCVRIDKCVFIVIKIKCVNSDRISDIYDKVNFSTNYIYFTISNNILSKHIQILQFLTHLTRRSRLRDLRISLKYVGKASLVSLLSFLFSGGAYACGFGLTTLMQM